jgi:hypothetical protein
MHHAMKTYRVVELWIHVFLIMTLDGDEWSVSSPGRFNPGGQSPRYSLDKGWVGPKISIHEMERREIHVIHTCKLLYTVSL